MAAESQEGSPDLGQRRVEPSAQQAFSQKQRSQVCIVPSRPKRPYQFAKGLSMRKAGQEIGVSDSYIAHAETSRMAPPRSIKVIRFLDAYGGIKVKNFYDRVRAFRQKRSDRGDLKELVKACK